MVPIEVTLREMADHYKTILGERLVGLYLHGSLAMGCYSEHASDVDFLVVVSSVLSYEEQRALVDVLVDMDALFPSKGVEMSVVLEEETRHFRYPTPFLLHYSNLHKERYLSQPGYVCGGFEDPDLAAHFMITRERGQCLYGKPIMQVFGEVPRRYYLASILEDVSEAGNGIAENPVYFTLNLCRVLCYLMESRVCSKKEGGEWGVKVLPMAYRDLVASALNAYLEEECQMSEDKALLEAFTGYMLGEIHRLSVNDDDIG